MTLGRFLLSIFCSRGTPTACPCGYDEWKSIEPTNPECITRGRYRMNHFSSSSHRTLELMNNAYDIEFHIMHTIVNYNAYDTEFSELQCIRYWIDTSEMIRYWIEWIAMHTKMKVFPRGRCWCRTRKNWVPPPRRSAPGWSPVSSHTKCFWSRLAWVNSSTNPSMLGGGRLCESIWLTHCVRYDCQSTTSLPQWGIRISSHRKCYETRFVEVNSHTNASICPLLKLLWRISWRIFVKIDFCKTTSKTLWFRWNPWKNRVPPPRCSAPG